MSKYRIVMSSEFRREYKKAQKRHYDMVLLDTAVELLQDVQPLPEKMCDHAFTGYWLGFRECHIQPDWLLVYRYYEDTLVLALARTGTHSDLNF